MPWGEILPYEIDWNIPLECITKEELLKRNEKRSHFILIDTIGNFEGNKYKVKGATTIPYPEVVDRRRDLMKYDEIIVYCTRKRCTASKKVASALIMLNVPNVKVYEGGIEEWLAYGLPVEEI